MPRRRIAAGFQLLTPRRTLGGNPIEGRMQISLAKIGSFLAGGFVTQAAGAIAGLLLARWMSVADYAIYTIGITVVGAIRLLTRSGVQMGLAAELARNWPDTDAAATALDAAMRVRMLVSALIMPPLLLAAWFLLERAGASPLVQAGILAILAVTWLADLYGSVLDQLLFFDGKALRMQMLDATISAGRLVLILVLRFLGLVSATTALLSNVFTVAARVPNLRSWVKASLSGAALRDSREVARTIRRVALRQLPVDIFVALQAQSAIFFLSMSGSDAMELATYGAIARIAQVLTPFSALIFAYFVPSFSKVRSKVVIHLLAYVAVGALPGLGLFGFVALSPETLLTLIGPNYAGQTRPLIVCAATVAVMSTVDVATNLVAHRGWNHWGWLRIGVGILWCAAAPVFIQVNTASGAYIFYCGFSVGTVIALVMDLLSARTRGEISLIREKV